MSEPYHFPVALDAEGFTQLKRQVREDETSRSLWLQRQASFLRRRFAVEDTQRRFPWPGASTIVMPTIDTTIERLMSAYIQSTLGPETPVTVRGQNPDSVSKEVNVERRLRHMLECRIPRVEREVAMAADTYLQHGCVTIGVAYDRRERTAREVLRRDRLPGMLGTLFGRAPMSEEDANLKFALTGESVLSQADVAQGEPEVRRLLRHHYGLDPEVRTDKKTEDAIYRWLRAGSTDELVIKRREVYRDTPVFFACLPEDVTVNAGVADEQDAIRVTLRRRLPKPRFQQEADACGWDPAVVKKVLDAKRATPDGTSVQQWDVLTRVRSFVHTRASSVFGASTIDNALGVIVYTTYFWHDIDGDGEPERCICQWTPGQDKPLAVYELPFDFYEWPVVHIKREHTSRGYWETRGLPEVLDALDREITEQHRQKLNSMAITNAPTLKGRINSGFTLPQWIPGQTVWVDRMDDVEPLVMPQTSVSYEREEQILQAWVERRAGVWDASLTDQGRLTRPRTATEITGVTSLQEQAIGAGLLIWHRGWSKVWRYLWALDVQYGPDELDLRVAGLDQPIRQTRHEIQGQFDFVPSSAALNSPALRLQKAQLLSSNLLQAIQAGVQFGDDYDVQPAEAMLMMLREIDSRVADRIIRKRTPQEVAKARADRMAAQAPVSLPPQAIEGPISAAAGRTAQAAELAGQVPINVSGVGGYV